MVAQTETSSDSAAGFFHLQGGVFAYVVCVGFFFCCQAVNNKLNLKTLFDN